MTGDLGSDAGRARSRPSFLPPVDGYPPPPGDPAGRRRIAVDGRQEGPRLLSI
ncbi:hypothetical protein HUX53_31500, partial [Actinomadura sp. BRA 177]|nr:hypothetical protein [Actinomadura sp. BRA 177]